MCGRFGFSMPTKRTREYFQLYEVQEYPARKNISPTMDILCLLLIPKEPGFEDISGKRYGRLLRWGLVPSWIKDLKKLRSPVINARCETLAEKPFFRAAYKSRRCLIPADNFYEWQKRDKKKYPHAIGMRDKMPFAMAGLWERWTGTDGSIIDSCTIITTNANELVAPIHDRMPVIIPPDAYDTWLDARSAPAHLQHLLVPFDANSMHAWPEDPAGTTPPPKAARQGRLPL